MHLAGLVLGSLETLLQVWLILTALGGSGWALIGLFVYVGVSLYSGSNVKNILLMLLVSGAIAIITIYYGFFGGVLAFVAAIVLGELFLKKKKVVRSSENGVLND